MKREVVVRAHHRAARHTERGIALVIAILALMMLTFLGLTLAATTSTELQIAANHRFAQQARYNAEAGIEAAKRVLMTANWQAILWPVRTGAPLGPRDLSGISARNDQFGRPLRHGENWQCDESLRGPGPVPPADPNVLPGYGVILDDGNPNPALGVYQHMNVRAAAGGAVQVPINGNFTVWVRYRLRALLNGQMVEDPDTVIITAEGTAPYRDDPLNPAAAAFIQSNRAVQVVEATVTRLAQARCGKDDAQSGGDAAGSGMKACDPTPDSLTSLQGAQAPGGVGSMAQGAYAGRR